MFKFIGLLSSNLKEIRFCSLSQYNLASKDFLSLFLKVIRSVSMPCNIALSSFFLIACPIIRPAKKLQSFSVPSLFPLKFSHLNP